MEELKKELVQLFYKIQALDISESVKTVKQEQKDELTEETILAMKAAAYGYKRGQLDLITEILKKKR
ncbi:MAG: hypothetical protein ACRBFS_24330 [Aureispira sp.]